MAEDASGPAAPIVSVRPGRNRLPDEDRALLEARRKRQQSQEHGHGGTGGQGGGHEEIQDDVTVLGIPKAEMTESVRSAINLLLDEINRLRAELMHAHGHEAYLEEQAEKDRLLHVMRRRAFLARIVLASRRVAEEQVQFSFIYIAVANAAAVRTQFGHGAAENLMMQAAAVLRESIEPGDVVGSLEQFDFGVLLPGTPIADAEIKAMKLVQGLNGRTFIWQGAEVGVKGVFGIAEVAPLDGGDELILRAKRDKDARNAEVGQVTP
jgi:diguanylate cyclase (GGDEF)-like protein